MTIEQQKEVLQSFTAQMEAVMLKKGNDYAGDADRLKNFKVAGAICGISPELQCLSLIATKVARLGTLLSASTKPDNESIDDSVLDLANYTVLLKMLLTQNPR